MKRAYSRVLFHLTVFALLLTVLIPAMFALQILFPAGSRPVGAHRGNPGMLIVVIIALVICLRIADRVASSLFRLVRLTDEHWSVFTPRRRD